MKKIGFVIPWYGEDIPGGAEMELRNLTHQLSKRQVELEILTTCVKSFSSDWSTDYHKPGLTQEAGLAVRRFKVRRRDTPRFDAVNYKLMNNIPINADEEQIYIRESVNSPDLYEYISSHKGDYSYFIFIPYMFGTTYYGALACLKKAVFIPCLHDESYAKLDIFRKLFPRVRGLLFNAKPEEKLANDLYDLSNVKTRVLGIGMDTGITGDPGRFRDKYRISGPFILYAGRKDAGKNVDLLIRYFAEYKQRRRDGLKLVIIGGGRLDIPARYSEDVIDLGFVDIQDKYDAYAACSVFCQPSRAESFSLVIMESWLLGSPVLVNDVCEVTRNFAQESNGGLYFKNYLEFEGCLRYILNHQDEARQMAQNGREYVLKNFSHDAVCGSLMEFLEQLDAQEQLDSQEDAPKADAEDAKATEDVEAAEDGVAEEDMEGR